jgi:hypothetical protein
MTDLFDPAIAEVGDPVTIIKGSYIAWRRAITLDPLLYSLKYTFIPKIAGTSRVVTGAAAGAYWAFFVLGSTSNAWAEGAYNFDVSIVRLSDNEASVIASGGVNVFAAASDRRSHAEIMVAKIESIMSGKADSDVESYTIAGRSISKMSPSDLMKWRDYYKGEIGVVTGKGGNRNKLKIRFVS